MRGLQMSRKNSYSQHHETRWKFNVRAKCQSYLRTKRWLAARIPNNTIEPQTNNGI